MYFDLTFNRTAVTYYYHELSELRKPAHISSIYHEINLYFFKDFEKKESISRFILLSLVYTTSVCWR